MNKTVIRGSSPVILPLTAATLITTKCLCQRKVQLLYLHHPILLDISYTIQPWVLPCLWIQLTVLINWVYKL